MILQHLKRFYWFISLQRGLGTKQTDEWKTLAGSAGMQLVVLKEIHKPGNATAELNSGKRKHQTYYIS